jgi:transcriptional regulator with XRE-family HTH domain
MSAGVSPQRQLEMIGSKVKRLRTEKGLSQDRLAIEAHVDQSGLSKFERGSKPIGKTPLTRIASVLGVTFEELIAGTDFKTGRSTPH